MVVPGYQVSGAFRCMEEALERVSRDLPDMALVDIGLPGMSGVDGIRQRAKLYPRLHLLVLSVYNDDDRIFDAICAGACGYLLKKPPARLLESISEVAGGGAPLSPEVARRVLKLFRMVRQPNHDDYQLTRRCGLDHGSSRSG